MPIYDYVCSNCRHRTEVIHGINDAGPRFCPNCGAEGTLRKGFSTPAILFKGSGWAKKDRAATRTPTSSRQSSDGTGSSSGNAKGGSDGGGSGTDSGSGAGTGSDAPSGSGGGAGSTSKSKPADTGGD